VIAAFEPNEPLTVQGEYAQAVRTHCMILESWKLVPRLGELEPVVVVGLGRAMRLHCAIRHIINLL
jgi:hypothetical protein